MNIDWSFLPYIDDVNTATARFYQSLYSVFDEFVPRCHGQSSKYSRCFDGSIITNIKLKTYY